MSEWRQEPAAAPPKRRKFGSAQAADTGSSARFYGGGGGAQEDAARAALPVYGKQQEAFDAAARHGPGARVWGMEYAAGGRRKFLASSDVSEFATAYLASQEGLGPSSKEQRSYYEVIREDDACRAYFDLEYSVPANPDADGEALTRTWVHLVAEEMYAQFGIEVGAANFVELDATTGVKFSRHLVLLLPGGALFANNRHVGRFVNGLLRRHGAAFEVTAAGSGGGDQPPPKTSFVDAAVYTRNRNFRLWQSHKFGKSAKLRVQGAGGARPHLAAAGAALGPAAAAAAAEAAAADPRRAMFENSLVVPAAAGGAVRLLRVGEDAAAAAAAAAPARRAAVPGSGVAGTTPAAAFPDGLSAWVVRVPAQRGGGGGSIRTRTVYADGTVAYCLQGNRYCERVGRQHKSNGVRIHVNVSHGSWHQQCFDPDCARWRGPSYPLPAELLHGTDAGSAECGGAAEQAGAPDSADGAAPAGPTAAGSFQR